MLITIIAVVGTLLGGLAGAATSGWFALRTASRAEAAAERQQLRRDRLEAVTALATAISDHRRTMWMRGEALLKGAAADRVLELKQESHATRAAVARPLISLRLLVPDPAVRTAADAMVTATYALRGAYSDIGTLAQARVHAMDAHDAFVEQAAAYLTTTTT
ncbi:hypothetical protein ACIOJG_37400 [Streptomyces anulatus]